MSIAEASDNSGRRSASKSAAAFRTISEVATELDVPPHVLRFWESKFPQIKPLKRGGGRRYYRPEDVDLLKRIRELLYQDGYTIKGVQKLLKSPGAKVLPGEDDDGPDMVDGSELPMAAAPAPVVHQPEPRLPTLALATPSAAPTLDAESRMAIEDVVAELEMIKSLLLAR
ncbi:MerR family transcriptional regulator [Lacibacterium aquatile]|uniref:MerR family transcriptional regulator n=1 Tax=Lacibacterium aquatile TaxID=1168082 RepID=A0ABW5DPE1_9PROT